MDYDPPDDFQMPIPMMKLRSSDGEIFEVEVKVAKLSLLIKEMLDDLGLEETEVISMPPNAPEISGAILRKIIHWGNHHKDDPAAAEDDEKDEKPTDDISSWDTEFLQVDLATLFQMIRVANYLNIKGLLNLTCKSVAKMMKRMTLEQTCQTFHIHNDFSPKEAERVRKENSWCEEVHFAAQSGRPLYGSWIGEIPAEPVQNSDTKGGQVIQDCVSNSVIVRKICQHFSNSELLQLSCVNKIWNYESRSVMKKRENVMAHLVCRYRRPCRCQENLEAFGADLRQMNVVIYSGVTIKVDSTRHEGVTAAMNSAYEAILARMALKHLSVRLARDWWEYQQSPIFQLVIKLLQDFRGLLQQLTLEINYGRLQFIEQAVQDCIFPSLKILTLLDLTTTSDEACTNYMKALVPRAPNLKELHTHGQTNLIENVLEGSTAVRVYKSRLDYPSNEISFTVMSALQLEDLELVPRGPEFDMERFNQITPVLLRASCTATLRVLCVHEILVVPLMCYGISLRNVKKLEMFMRPYGLGPVQAQFLSIVKNIDFTRLFPSLNRVCILPELVDFLVLPYDAVFEQANAVLREPEPDRAVNIKELYIEPWSFWEETAPFYAEMFPAIEKLEIVAKDVPFDSIWKYWVDLKEVKANIMDYQIGNLDSVFCGIFPQEVAELRQRDEEYLQRVHIVPVMPAITCLKNLNTFTLQCPGRRRYFDQEPYVDEGDGTFMFSKVTGFVAFQKCPSLSVGLNFYCGVPPETSHLEPFASVTFN